MKKIGHETILYLGETETKRYRGPLPSNMQVTHVSISYSFFYLFI